MSASGKLWAVVVRTQANKVHFPEINSGKALCVWSYALLIIMVLSHCCNVSLKREYEAIRQQQTLLDRNFTSLINGIILLNYVKITHHRPAAGS